MSEKSDKANKGKLGKRVARWRQTWRRQQDMIKERDNHVKSDRFEGLLFFLVAINQRRHYRRYLRARFGYDMLRCRVVNPSRLPKTRYEHQCNYNAQRKFLIWDTAFLVASYFADRALATGGDPFLEAGRGVLMALQDSALLDGGSMLWL